VTIPSEAAEGASGTIVPMYRAPWSVRFAGYALPLILLLFIAFFSLAAPTMFPTWRTVETLLRTESVSAILAIALIFPLVVGEYDLTVAANLGLAAILVTGLPSQQGLSLELSMAIAVVVCGLVGLANGLLVAKVGINALVATLGVSVMVTGAVFWYTRGDVFYSNIPPLLPKLAHGNLAGIPLPAVFLAVVALAAWYALDQTPLGRYLYAVGGSKDASRLSGLNVDGLTILAFVIAGVLAAVAGILQAAQLGSGNPNIGPPFLLPAFAATYLGATAFRVGEFNVAGTIVAVFTVAIGITGLQLMGMDFFVAPIFQGAALIAAVTAARYLKQQRI
jgi:ribose transport system permease protein